MDSTTPGIFAAFFTYISNFGEVSVYLIAFTVFWCIDKKLGSVMILSGALATELCGIGKLITGSSFPSNHAANATFCYGFLGYHYRKYKIMSWCFYIIMLLVMYSKIYEGLHTPQDVVGGFLLTMLIILLVGRLLQWIEGGPNRDLIMLIGIIMIFIACMLFFQFKIDQLDAAGKLNIGKIDPKTITPYLYWMTGLLSGTFLGWFFERRFVKFTTNVHISKLIARFLTGWLAFIFIHYVCSNMFLLMFGSNWGSFSTTAVLGFYCVAIHPYLFTKFENRKGDIL